MLPFKKCPVCSGEIVEKKVEKLIRGGMNTAIVNVNAEICLHCGERYYSEEIIKQFEKIRKQLKHQDTENFEQIGKSYKIKNTEFSSLLPEELTAK